MKKTSNYLWVILLLVSLFGIPASKAAASPSALPAAGDLLRFNHLRVEDGLPSATVLGMLQDQQGFLWFATSDGIARYDGYEFKLFRHDPRNANSLSNNNTFAILETQDGKIWVGTDPGGLDCYDPQTDLFTHYRHDPQNPNSLPNDSIWSLLEDAQGNLWVGTRGGLSRLDPQDGTFTNWQPNPEEPNSLAGAVVYALYEDKDSKIWIGTRFGLQRYDPQTDTFTTYTNDPENPLSLSNNSVWGIVQDYAGDIWVATRGGGINRLDAETQTFTSYQHNPEDSKSLSDNRTWSIVEDSQRMLWIGTENGGVNRFDPLTQTFTHFQHNPNNPESINNNDIYRILQDNSGVMWFASRYGGVSLAAPAYQRFYNLRNIPGDPNSLRESSVYSIFATPDTLWVGTFGGGLHALNRQTGQMQVFFNDPQNPNSLSNDKVYSIYADPYGRVWVATSGGGLNRYDLHTRQWKAYRYTGDDENDISSSYVTVVRPAGGGRLWLGTLGFGLDLFDTYSGKKIITYANDPADPNSLSENTVYDIAVQSNGDVWLATARGGLEKLNPQMGQFVHYRNQPGTNNTIASDTVHALYLDEAAGILWAATSEGISALHLESQTWQTYTTQQGLPSNTITSIQPGAEGALWVGTTRGLSHFSPQQGVIQNYDVRDGLQGNQFSIASSGRASDGELFFGGPNGLTCFSPDSMYRNPTPPQVHFTHLELFNRAVDVGSDVLPAPLQYTPRLSLAHTQSVITLHFAALGHQISARNQYQYMLVGFDTEWSPPRSLRQATYTNLPPGDYTFLVRASNNDGVWNEEPARLQIYIQPPWWGTLWFRLLALFAFGGVVAGGLRWRMYQVNQTNRKLEILVAQRTSELRKEIVQRQRMEEQILQTNQVLQTKLDEITRLQIQLREQAITDSLTSLYNRRYLEEIMRIELSRATRYQHPICLAIADIDHFKRVNDTYGHQAGDQVLRQLSACLQSQIRKEDYAFRYGGEEFLLILPGMGMEEGVQRASQILDTVRSLQVQYEDEVIQVTLSIGVAAYPRHSNNVDHLLSLADDALYEAKQQGRDRIVTP